MSHDRNRFKLSARRKPLTFTPKSSRKAEQWLLTFREKHILAKIQYGIGGLRARVGALVTGSGFAFGPEFYRDDLADGRCGFG